MSGVYWGLAGTLGTHGPEGVWEHQGVLGDPRGYRGCMGAVWGVRGVRDLLGLAGTLGTQGPEGV